MKRMSYYIIGLLLSLMSWSCSDDAEKKQAEKKFQWKLMADICSPT